MTRKTLNTRDASAYLGISESSLRHARMRKPQAKRISPPPHVRLGRRIFYLKDDLDRWIEANRVVTAIVGGVRCPVEGITLEKQKAKA